MNDVARRTVNIANGNFTTTISMPPEPVFQNMGEQMSGLDKTQMVRAFDMNTKVSSSPQVEAFLSHNLRHFHKNIWSWI